MKNTMDSLDAAIQTTCREYPGSIKALASDLSIAQGTLYNKCNPGMTSHCLNLQEALNIMRLSQNFSILQVLCRKTHHACISKVTFQHISDMILFEAWTACDMEHGKTVAMIREALEDKRIDEIEFHKIRSEMFIDFARELELLDRLRQYSGLPESPSSVENKSLKESVNETVQTSPLEFKILAASANMREIELRKKSDLHHPDDTLTILEALNIMLATNNYGILHTLSGQLKHTCIEIPHYEGINDMELLDAWSSWSDERSDTISTIHKALVDGTTDRDELILIEKEMFQDFHTELALLARLRIMIQ